MSPKTFHLEIDDYTKEAFRSYLSRMSRPVEVKFFTSSTCGSREINWCVPVEELLDLLEELAQDKIVVRKYRYEDSLEEFTKYGVLEKSTPLICLCNCIIRYFGAPFGEEIRSFLDALVMCSTGQTRLKSYTKRALRKIAEDERAKRVYAITVVTQSCPYCPHAVSLVNSFAIESRGKMLSIIYDASVDPELAERYNIMIVPAIIMRAEGEAHGRVEFVGVPSEYDLLEKVIKYSGLDVGSLDLI